MKISIIFGLILGFGIILLTVFSNQNTSYYLNWSALAITLGGTLAAIIIYFSPNALRLAFAGFFKLFSEKVYLPNEVVNLIVDISKEAHNTSFKNIIKMESVNKMPFLKKGLTLVADGTDTNHLEEIMLRESKTITERGIVAERVFRMAGSFAPMFGMMGTVIGLIAMLHRVENPSAIPAAMGLALVTTLYGLILSALVFKPISGKIRDKNQIDSRIREIIIEGVLSIRRGENSQITKERLEALKL